MQQELKASVKTNKIAKKATNALFYNSIRKFLKSNFDISSDKKVTEFLNHLHSIDYVAMFDKTFTLEYKTLKKSRNMSYLDWDRDENTQKIAIRNNWKNSSSVLFKKATILDLYFHEVTHEKQVDFADISDCLKLNAYEKMLTTEYLEYANIPYELRLRELDARIKGVHSYIDLLKKGILPINEETLYNPLSNIDDIIFAFNRFKVANKDVEFNIDIFVKRYFASMILDLKADESDEDYAYLFDESFRIKFRVALNKILNNFKKDIEYVYSKLMEVYKVSNRVKTKLKLSNEAEANLYLDAKNYKCNDYYLNLMYLDLKDRYYHTQVSVSPTVRKEYIQKEK